MFGPEEKEDDTEDREFENSGQAFEADLDELYGRSDSSEEQQQE